MRNRLFTAVASLVVIPTSVKALMMNETINMMNSSSSTGTRPTDQNETAQWILLGIYGAACLIGLTGIIHINIIRNNRATVTTPLLNNDGLSNSDNRGPAP